MLLIKLRKILSLRSTKSTMVLKKSHKKGPFGYATFAQDLIFGLLFKRTIDLTIWHPYLLCKTLSREKKHNLNAIMIALSIFNTRSNLLKCNPRSSWAVNALQIVYNIWYYAINFIFNFP